MSRRNPAPDLRAILEVTGAAFPGHAMRRLRRPDGTFRYTYASPHLRQSFGLDVDRILAQDPATHDWVHADDRPRLIAALHARHVEAWALAGDVSWVRGTAAEAHAQAIATFNAEGEPYDGVQHDTELTSLPGFRTDPQGLTDTFVATIDAARAAAGVPFTVATVVWLDPPLFTEIAAHVDGVALMDYRDDVTRIEKDASEELAGTTPVWLGLELMEDPEGDAVSFHEEGHDSIVAAMETVEADEAAAPAFAGMAVHDWDAWVTTP